MWCPCMSRSSEFSEARTTTALAATRAVDKVSVSSVPLTNSGIPPITSSTFSCRSGRRLPGVQYGFVQSDLKSATDVCGYLTG